MTSLPHVLQLSGCMCRGSMRMRRKSWSTEAVRTSCLVGTLATMILLWTVARRLVRRPCLTRWPHVPELALSGACVALPPLHSQPHGLLAAPLQKVDVCELCQLALLCVTKHADQSRMLGQPSSLPLAPRAAPCRSTASSMTTRALQPGPAACLATGNAVKQWGRLSPPCMLP